jgi:hypothetical protein
MATKLIPKEEDAFKDWWRTNSKVKAWRNEFKKDFGFEPSPNSQGYDYRGAWKAGIKPESTYEPETKQTRHHWGSLGVGGKDLKSKKHPTRWKSDYMKVTGSNPDDEGISEAEAKKMLREVFFHDDYIN